MVLNNALVNVPIAGNHQTIAKLKKKKTLHDNVQIKIVGTMSGKAGTTTTKKTVESSFAVGHFGKSF